jgi:hypothetical protein
VLSRCPRDVTHARERKNQRREGEEKSESARTAAVAPSGCRDIAKELRAQLHFPPAATGQLIVEDDGEIVLIQRQEIELST